MSEKEQWIRVGVSGSIRGRRSEEMIQSNTSCLWVSQVPFKSQRGRGIEVPQNKKISEGGKNGRESSRFCNLFFFVV